MPRPKPPTRKLHVVSDMSAEGLIDRGVAHPEKTMLYLRDELAGVFGDLNKYRGGKGSDRQLLLETFNGASIKSVRVGKDSKIHHEMLLSIFGGIQPQVLQKIMGDGGDADGLWGRFLFCIQPSVAAPTLPDWETPFTADLSARLGTIYERIERLAPVEYQLSREAYEMFSVYRDKLEQMRVDRTNCPLIRHFAGKLQGITNRIALNLHCFWAAAKNECVTTNIAGDMMARAIDVAQFALAQAHILAAQTDQTEGDSGKLYKLTQLLKERPFVTVREVQRRITRGVSDMARSLIDRAAKLGFVRWIDRKTAELMGTPQTTADIPQPQPPTVDREVTVPEIPKVEVVTQKPAPVKHGKSIEYQLSADGNTIEWIEIYFEKHAIAKDWKNLTARWGGKTYDLQMRTEHKNNWLLMVNGLPIERLEILLNAKLWQSPKVDRLH